MTQVFISYSRKDLSFINTLVADLKNAGLDVWYDVSHIAGGARWRSEIENALRNSQYVIVVLSPDSIASEWVEREFLFSSNLRRKIIPVMYRFCELPLNYVDLNYIDMQGNNYGRNFHQLLKALQVDPTASVLPASVARSPSFKWKPQYLALAGGVAVLTTVLLGSFLMRDLFAPEAAPTAQVTAPALSAEETQVPVTEPPTEASQIRDPSDIPMVLVPAGEFTMGSDNIDEALAECQSYYTGCDESWFIEEQSAHTVYLDDYYIDLYEVTNVLYADCVNTGVCEPPTYTGSATRDDYYGNSEFEHYPVIFVDWKMAKTYCEWREARLPTEAEWEKAARGADARTYAWGDKLDPAALNYNEEIGDTVEAGNYDGGTSPYGLYDMAGNVWEWVADYYSSTYYQDSPSSNPLGPESGQEHVLRGGSWYDPSFLIRATSRLKAPDPVGNNFGFRCARDGNS
jgi:formylglycine-generating enzyme required for sulfatase activity